MNDQIKTITDEPDDEAALKLYDEAIAATDHKNGRIFIADIEDEEDDGIHEVYYIVDIMARHFPLQLTQYLKHKKAPTVANRLAIHTYESLMNNIRLLKRLKDGQDITTPRDLRQIKEIIPSDKDPFPQIQTILDAIGLDLATARKKLYPPVETTQGAAREEYGLTLQGRPMPLPNESDENTPR